MRASGFSAPSVFTAQVVVSLAMTLVGAVLVIAATALVYDVSAPAQPAGVVGVFLIVALAFAAIGLFLGAVMPTARAAQGAGILLFFVMLMLSGAGPPPEVMSPSMRAIADALPLTHAIALLQDPWLGFAWAGSALAALLGFLLVSAALALRLFRWD